VITIDANVFLRTLAAHQADHMTCRTLLERLQALAIPIIVPRLLLTELARACGARRVMPCAPECLPTCGVRPRTYSF
jgi:predicted nucleic acid-binding protein